MSSWCLQIFQNTNEIFSRNSALASKKRSIQKKLGHFIPRIEAFYFESITLLFDLTSFKRLGQKPWKKLVGPLEDLNKPKGHLKIN